MADLTAGGVPVYRDSGGVLREKQGQAEIDALSDAVAAKADSSAIPKPANAAPMAERTGAAIGNATTRFALEDHQHPRLTSTTPVTIASGNMADVTFTRTFDNEPGIAYNRTSFHRSDHDPASGRHRGDGAARPTSRDRLGSRRAGSLYRMHRTRVAQPDRAAEPRQPAPRRRLQPLRCERGRDQVLNRRHRPQRRSRDVTAATVRAGGAQ